VAWLSAYRFARRPATFVGLDDVVFKKPVEVAGYRRDIVGRWAGDRRVEMDGWEDGWDGWTGLGLLCAKSLPTTYVQAP
jgi:hypothetical protein